MSAALTAKDAGGTEQFPNPPRDCALCPRLHGFLQHWRAEEPSWHNAPVQSFLPVGGLPAARLLMVGLAPGLRGANRTGRPFTGDLCGAFFYDTLLKFGFAEGHYAARPDDGLRLRAMAIVNAVRCAPPENKPKAAEITACRHFLRPYLRDLPRLRAVVTLGKVAHESALRALGLPLSAVPFIHGQAARLERFWLVPSYHCSHYNTATGRLTKAMFDSVFAQARQIVDSE